MQSSIPSLPPKAVTAKLTSEDMGFLIGVRIMVECLGLAKHQKSKIAPLRMLCSQYGLRGRLLSAFDALLTI